MEALKKVTVMCSQLENFTEHRNKIFLFINRHLDDPLPPEKKD